MSARFIREVNVFVDASARLRLLGTLLVGTVVLALLPTKNAPSPNPSLVEPELPIRKSALSVAPGVKDEAMSVTRPAADPFAFRQWSTAPVNAPDVVPQIVSAAAPREVAKVEPVREVPISLPYRFAGRYVSDGDVTLYLLRGEEVVVANLGAILDGQWRVSKVESSQIELIHLGTGKGFAISTAEKND